MSVEVKRLGPSEWGRLAEAYAGARSDEPLPKRQHGIVIAAEDGGRLVGCAGAERVWCASPLWVRKEMRGTGLAERLSRELAAHNAEGLTEMLVTTSRHVELMVYGMGFIPVQGTLWRRK